MQNVPECMQNVPECMQNVPQCMQKVPECMQNVPECMQNIPECLQKVPECSRMHAECSRMHSECSKMHAECSRMHAECSRIHVECSRMNDDGWGVQIEEDFFWTVSDKFYLSTADQCHPGVTPSHPMTIMYLVLTIRRVPNTDDLIACHSLSFKCFTKTKFAFYIFIFLKIFF